MVEQDLQDKASLGIYFSSSYCYLIIKSLFFWSFFLGWNRNFFFENLCNLRSVCGKSTVGTTIEFAALLGDCGITCLR